MEELTFGQKAVGLTFNPAGDTRVTTIKQKYADIIDLLDAERNEAFAQGDKEKGRHLAVAITDAETAQMRAVKGLTWGMK
jgi:hypothetical protein